MSIKYGITGSTGIVGTRLVKLCGDDAYVIGRGDIQDCTKSKENIDTLIHLAARYSDSVNEVLDSNIVLILKVIDYCQKNKISRVIFFSGMKVYGDVQSDNLNEESPLYMPNLYGASKYFGEQMFKDSGITTIVLRLPGLLTLNSKTDFISKVLNNMNLKENVTITNYNLPYNNFISVDDVMKFIRQLSFQSSYDVINLAVSSKHTLLDVVEYIKDRTKSNIDIIKSNSIQNHYIISTERAESKYQFHPPDQLKTIDSWLQLNSL